MTPISQMTEEELRVAVAEARGWKFMESNPDEGGSFAGWWKHPNGTGCGYTDSVLPELDANAAESLCNALAEQGWNIVIGRREITKEYWTVKFERGYLNMHEATGLTLSIAIARAYLAVVQSQTPTTP